MNYNIVVSTKDLSRTDWLRHRQKGIGGSDVPGILGSSSYSSPLKVYLEKTREITDSEPEIDNEAMRQGRDFEQYCADRFEERTGKKVRRINAIIQHPSYPFIIANIDRRVEGENAILECKTTKFFDPAETDSAQLANYKLQCYHYLLATGADKCYLAILVFGTAVHVIDVDRDEALLAMLLQREIEFWDMVEKGTPPEWDGSDAANEILKDRFPEVQKGIEVPLVSSDYEHVKQIGNCTKLIKQLEQQREEHKQHLLEKLGEAEYGTYDGQQAVRRIWVAGRETLDAKKLRTEKPDVYEQYKKAGAGYARLEVRGTEE